MSDDPHLTKYDKLCREVYGDARMAPGTREVVLAMGWVMFRHPDRPQGGPFWQHVRRVLGRNRYGKPRVWDLIAADAPRYEQPGGHHLTGPCEGPRHRPYKPRPAPRATATGLREAQTIVHVPPAGAPAPYDPTDGGRVCGASGSIRVTEADMVTGWTRTHWFCRRHHDRARQVQAQYDALGDPPPPIPNIGGLLPCYFTADWETVYAEAVRRTMGAPYTWERPYHGLAADEWPVPGRQPIPRRPRLSIITGAP
ncbi:hypothetical protein [Thermomonospora umbrina]|uniref:Uncharacterized protein n=1 Tax=Thermomonospora umbrina TaxID=111806 RepID=A0A3D9SWJ2_9ACTN|nr:hypothetical protein [Thermomonospora umbrina]REF00323.1 hypothetical protein DFJ69_5854 [Thermomonospora umbrina]